MLIDHIHDQLGRYRIGAISDAMPDFVKTAEDQISTEDLTKLADGCFAYSDGINRFFPIHTPEHTWMSHAYFEKFANTFEDNLAKEIGDKIHDAYLAFELPENNIVKIAAQEDELDNLHALSIELNKFIDDYKKLPIEDRRTKAKDILHKAHALGKEKALHDTVYRYSGDHLRHDHAHAFAKRMQYFNAKAPERHTLLQMQEEAKNHIPELIAKALSIFDRKTGLHKYYDSELEDPYCGILAPFEAHEKAICFGEHHVMPSKLKHFNFDELSDVLGDHVISALKQEPVAAIQGCEPSIRMIIIRKING